MTHCPVPLCPVKSEKGRTGRKKETRGHRTHTCLTNRGFHTCRQIFFDTGVKLNMMPSVKRNPVQSIAAVASQILTPSCFTSADCGPMCRRLCEWGFRRDARGCPLCECRSSQSACRNADCAFFQRCVPDSALSRRCPVDDPTCRRYRCEDLTEEGGQSSPPPPLCAVRAAGTQHQHTHAHTHTHTHTHMPCTHARTSAPSVSCIIEAQHIRKSTHACTQRLTSLSLSLSLSLSPRLYLPVSICLSPHARIPTHTHTVRVFFICFTSTSFSSFVFIFDRGLLDVSGDYLFHPFGAHRNFCLCLAICDLLSVLSCATNCERRSMCSFSGQNPEPEVLSFRRGSGARSGRGAGRAVRTETTAPAARSRPTANPRHVRTLTPDIPTPCTYPHS